MSEMQESESVACRSLPIFRVDLRIISGDHEPPCSRRKTFTL